MAYYRLYFFRPRAHGIIRFEEIEAESDADAIATAETHRGEHALELWNLGRIVTKFEATDIASRHLARRAKDWEKP